MLQREGHRAGDGEANDAEASSRGEPERRRGRGRPGENDAVDVASVVPEAVRVAISSARDGVLVRETLRTCRSGQWGLSIRLYSSNCCGLGARGKKMTRRDGFPSGTMFLGVYEPRAYGDQTLPLTTVSKSVRRGGCRLIMISSPPVRCFPDPLFFTRSRPPSVTPLATPPAADRALGSVAFVPSSCPVRSAVSDRFGRAARRSRATR